MSEVHSITIVHLNKLKNFQSMENALVTCFKTRTSFFLPKTLSLKMYAVADSILNEICF